MTSVLRAEFRKLLSVRSTYFISLASLVLCGFLAFWVYGYKDVEGVAASSSVLLHTLYAAIGVAGLFMSFVIILQVGHEYRYNTINYTLSASNSRSKIFAAKFVACLLFALAVTAAISLISAGLFYLGLKIHNITPSPQYLDILDLLARWLVSVAGGLAFAYIVIILSRSLIGAIAFILVVPTTVEQLLGLLLKENVKYLPFTALGQLTSDTSKISFMLSAGVVAAYTLVGGLIAWLFFLRRDAS